MKTNARNQFTGIVKRIRSGDIDNEVTITLPGDHELVVIVTRENCNDLGLNVSSAIIALVESTAIIIVTNLEHIKLSARSRLNGLICEVERGAANSVITTDLGSGLRLTMGVTLQSTERLNLHPGQRATTISKADGIVLGMLV